MDSVQISINKNKKYQVVNSFGASAAWWAQDVGGWKEKEDAKLSKRDYIAELLFDKKKGIGLSSYRYNLGAGSTDPSNSVKTTDSWRKAESFESAPGVYDWSKDANAQYMLNKAVSFGVNDVYLFANSPLVRLTKNGQSYGELSDSTTSNLSKDNYEQFSTYLLDVTDHFVEKGIPVTHLSPINEPQWEWTGGQEGNHYTPEEMIAFSKKIVNDKKNRSNLANVTLSVPELGEWGNTSYEYYEAMIADPEFMKAYPTWDIHSYWSTAFQKQDFVQWLEKNKVKPTLKMSEWTEMENGKDVGMTSAMTLVNQIYEDLSILNVVDWQYWIAVSAYDYKDGLIYVDKDTHKIEVTKRLWAMGNFSKFIRPNAQRISIDSTDEKVSALGFINADSKNPVLVFINNDSEEKSIVLPKEYQINEAYETSKSKDLGAREVSDKQQITLPGKAILTIQTASK